MSKYDFSNARVVSQEGIEQEYVKFMEYISTFSQERQDQLTAMYSVLQPRLMTAPASSKVYFHNSFVGGYLYHVNHVIQTALYLVRVYAKIGGVVDATQDEIMFAAMHHDLGKLGDEDGPFYIRETDQYWIDKGANFKSNSDVQQMPSRDRTVYLLNKYGVKYTKKELIGMQMADGMFDPANDAYFKGNAIFPHKTSIGYIVHWADWMACIAEKDVQRCLCEGS